MPAGHAKVPLVVLVHGSEQSSALDFYSLQRLLPSAGIGAFVYDKRGCGASTGTFTHDYRVLAADAAEAVRAARKLAGARATRVGFQGSSQGGWVAPLAATMTRVDFIVVSYGLAVSPLDEDDEAVMLDMTRHGFGDTEIPKALEVARAAQAIVLTGFQSGYEELDAVRARYAQEPWLKFVRGNVTQVLLSQPREVLREQGPVLFAGILPHYDPMPVLRRLDTPQLWVLAADDIDAPVAQTVRRLRGLAKDGRPITTVIYPRTEHGMYEFEVDAAGERASTRQPATYLPLMSDFIRRGAIRAHYGDSTIYR
jgi:pimeloyl-ACP methyl ester carboxylesterase